MPQIVLLGLNHNTAPVEVRECIAFSPDSSERALEALQGRPEIGEAMILSTCNRVEVLLVSGDSDQGIRTARRLIADFNQVPESAFETALYIHREDDAVRHVFRVAASLDSMMVGEPQILGQIKAAYRHAVSKRTCGVVLNRLLHKAFSVAKQVRNETGIGDHAVSISYAAIEMGRKIFGALEGKPVLLVGAGEMAELAVEHLIRQRAGRIHVANRTFERGLDLAGRFNGRAVRFEEIPDCLEHVDIIISSTGSPDFVIRPEHVKRVLRRRRNRPLFFIDIAVPRDIDPAVNRLTNTYVYDIDDLNGIIEENIEDRNREAIKGERIVDEAVIRFRQWRENLDVVPTIVALRKKFERIVQAEVDRSSRSLPETEKKRLRKMTASLVNKMLHDPTRLLKGEGSHTDRSVYLDAVRKLFRLDE